MLAHAGACWWGHAAATCTVLVSQVDVNSNLREATVWWDVSWDVAQHEGRVASPWPVNASKKAQKNRVKATALALERFSGPLQAAVVNTMRSRFTPVLKFRRDDGKGGELEKRFATLDAVDESDALPQGETKEDQ